jgi:protease-4
MKFFRNLVLLSVVVTTSIHGALVYDMAKKNFSVESMGMANAYTAFPEGNAGALLNPASLAYPGAGYSFQYLDFDNLDYQTYQAHYYHNKPFGISSVFKEDFNGNKLRMNVFGLGVFGDNGISWGLNYKSLSGRVNSTDVKGWSSDLGVLVRVSSGLNFGFLVQDIYSKNLDLDTTIKGSMAGFLSNNLISWALEVTYDNDVRKNVTTSFGTEFLMSDTLILRSGISQSSLFSGASLQLPFMGLDFGIKNDIKDSRGSYYSAALKIGRGSDLKKFKKRYALFKQDAYAEMMLGGNVKNGKSSVSLFGGNQIGSNDLLKLIHEANKDSSCRGYIIRVGNFQSSFTNIGLVQEIRSELEKSKALGKKIIVYLEGMVGLPEYYLASLGDVIIMPPLGTIRQFGIDLEVKKAADFFDKLGINTTVFSSGKHKGATNLFTDELTDMDKEQLNNLIKGLFEDVNDQITEARPDVVSALALISDGAMITAKRAKELGLVDRLAYWPDVYEIVDTYDRQLEKLNLNEFVLEEYNSVFNIFDRIAVIEIDGSIVNGDYSTNFISGSMTTGADEFDKIVKKVSDDRSFKGVILRINSPGGSVLASDRIYTAIQKLKESGKLVYSSMGSIATSGGYYVAANSDKIYANSSCITGSIGVISSFRSLSNLGKELGIKQETLKTGKYMDLYSSLNSLDDSEKQLIKNFQNTFYQEFINIVQTNRDLTDDEVAVVSQGQLFSGKQAKQMKIIDDLGGFYDVVDSMASDLNIANPKLVFMRSDNSFKLPFGGTNIMSKLVTSISSYVPMLNNNYFKTNNLQFLYK